MKGINNINIAVEYIPSSGPSSILNQVSFLTHDIDIVSWIARRYTLNRLIPLRMDLGEIAFPYYILIKNGPVDWYDDVRVWSPESYGIYEQFISPGRAILLMPESNEIYAQGAAVIWVMIAQLKPFPPTQIGPTMTGGLSFSADFAGVIPIKTTLDSGSLGFSATLDTSKLPNLITNGGFETGDMTGWVIADINPPPAANNLYGPTPVAGTYDCLVGNVTHPGPSGGISWMYQEFTVPIIGGSLVFWHWDYSEDTIFQDYQYVYLSDTGNSSLYNFFQQCVNTQIWIKETLDLTPWAGRTLRINFVVAQSDALNVTGMFIDEVSVH